ncbi:MAG: hypothetical protein A2161_11045 [Candidatus Schekmanbacteria bacterium RBG_13_48_7]|uniref:Glycosyltransferase RgtA/B/C/D-like domain-containing protein n=1 Tax=Candidatus Schekmanbacteria bacterium RBG_13_48_7 TaxID=1817878 RepID=A0A1F7SAL1_9BACT|nr:MAG: hypothetical protein A2161_11045 [Candidatus Schekmanbacteria bacterium RBG_13_48_7]
MIGLGTRMEASGEERRLVVLIFLLSLILRLIYALSHPTLPTIIDAADFDVIANNLSIGNGFGYGVGDLTSWRAPGYPFFLAGIYYLFGHSYYPVWFFEALAGALLPVFIFYIVKSRFSFEIAVIGASICAIYPNLITIVNPGLADNLFSVLTAGMMLVLINLNKKPAVFFLILAGLVAGVNILTKSVFLPFLLVIVPVCMYFDITLRPRLKWYPVTIIAALLILTPWIARNYNVHHRFVLVNTNGGFTLWYNNNNLSETGYYWGVTAANDRQTKINQQIQEREKLINSPDTLLRIMTPIVRKHYWQVFDNVGTPELKNEFENLSEAEADQLFFKKAFDHIKTHKLRFIKKSIRSAIKFFHVFDEGADYQVFWGILFPFSLLGIAFSFNNWRKYLLFYGLIINIWIVCTIFESSVRYRVPVEPYFFIFSIYGVFELFKKHKKLFIFILALVLCLNVPGIFYPEELRHEIRNLITSVGFDVIPW